MLELLRPCLWVPKDQVLALCKHSKMRLRGRDGVQAAPLWHEKRSPGAMGAEATSSCCDSGSRLLLAQLDARHLSSINNVKLG